MATLPRGIRLITWKNKDGSKSVRYRVRREFKNEQGELEVLDQSFDTAEEAEEFLKLSKTTKGKELIYSITEEQRKKQEAITELLLEPPLGHYIDLYVKMFVEPKIKEADPNDKKRLYIKKRNVSTLKTFYKTIKNTEIEYKHKSITVGVFGTSTTYPKKKVADFKIREFGTSEINDYIRTRLQHRTKKGTLLKKSSVCREVSLFSVFFTSLNDGDLSKEFEGKIDNPVLKHNKKLLANANEKRKFVLTQEMEDKLFGELEKTNNKELLPICKLSLYTAMRRSEIICLKWNEVDLPNHQIHLPTSKTGKSRDVYILPEVAELLKELPKRNGDPYVFKTPTAGFEGTFDKLKARIGLKGIRFHDFRRQAIRNMILRLAEPTGNYNNSILIAHLLGLNSPAKLEENHIRPIEEARSHGINNQDQALKSIGHYNSDETAGYFNVR